MQTRTDLFPKDALLIVRGTFTTPRSPFSFYFNKQLLERVDAHIDTHHRSHALAHLIATGLAFYLTHKSPRIDYSKGFCGLTDANRNLPLRTGDKEIRCAVEIIGREHRPHSTAINVTLPDDLIDLCTQYVRTIQSTFSDTPNSTTWINHLTARGLDLYEQKKKTSDVLITEGFYGVKDFPFQKEVA